MIENLVIGSGPTGVSVAYALLKKGKKVSLLDIGFDIEKENKNLPQTHKNQKNLYKYLDKLKSISKIKGKYSNPNLKFPFGSDYVFRVNDYESITKNDIDFIHSNALGGLSNIWASLVSPFHKNDIKDWPLSQNDFYENEKFLEDFINISSESDNLDMFYDTKIGKSFDFPMSKQSNNLFTLLEQKQENLNLNGIYFGRSKLALGNLYSVENKKCQTCGLCHFGCPYDNIYNSKFTLEKFLNNNNNFEHLSGFFAKRILQNKNSDNGELEVIDINNGFEKKISYKKIYLCLGPICTAMLVLRSNLIDKNELVMKESQRFFIPFFIKKPNFAKYSYKKNTLPEIFLTYLNEKFSDRSVHLQVYSFSEIMLRPLTKYLGNFAYKLPKLFPFLFNNLYILLGYLHSDDSNKLKIKFDSFSDNKFRYSLEEVKLQNQNQKINNLLKILKKDLNFMYMPFSPNIGKTGSSYHYGGTFPMSNDSNIKNSTDTKGLLYGYKNLFIADQSILPDTPGSPTTYNAMVNAVRIILKNEK